MRIRSLFAVAACLALFSACSGGSKPEKKAAEKGHKAAGSAKEAAKPAGLSDPAVIGKKFLEAFKAKDVETMKALSTPIMRMAAWGNPDNVKSQFSSWGDEVGRWDGTIKDVRYYKEAYENAAVYFVKDVPHAGVDMDEVVIVVLSHFMSKDWAWETFSKMDRKKFEALSKTPVE